VSRKTITRILSQQEVRTLLDGYRDEYRDLVPLALEQLRRDLSVLPKRGRHANPATLKAAIEVTKGAQVAVPRSQGELDVRTDQFASMSDKELDDYIADMTAKLKAVAKPGSA
jgi:hypothetical protein